MKKSSIQRFNIVLFWFMNDWGMYGRAYEKIAENLSAQDEIKRVLVIMPPIRNRKAFGVLPFKYRKISKKLIVLTPNERIIPHKYELGKIGKKLNERGIPFAVLKFIKLLSFKETDTILWLYPPHPYIDELVKFLPHKALVTQIVDNSVFKKNHTSNRIEFARKQYDELSKLSDVVITSSKMNFDYFSRLNSSCYLFENAVDFVFLRSPSNFPYATGNRRPRIGYTGYISERTNTELLRYIAEKRPEYDLVLAGPVEISTEEFEKLLLPNVCYEGVIPYEKMPDFLKNLDICLIPHHDNLYSRSMSPLKLFQYLASGRPIVSTKVAGVDRWKDLIALADSYDDFVLKIDETFQNDTNEKSRIRIDAARLETWDKRVKNMIDAVIDATGMS